MNSMEEVKSILKSRLNLQLATIDEAGYPNIQPVWFEYNEDENMFHILSSSKARKTLNIRNKGKVYFSVDDCNIPYKGVKGRGTAMILEESSIVRWKLGR